MSATPPATTRPSAEPVMPVGIEAAPVKGTVLLVGMTPVPVALMETVPDG